MRLRRLVGLFLFLCAGLLYTANGTQLSESFFPHKHHFSQQQHKISQLTVVDKESSFAEIEFEKEESLFGADFSLFVSRNLFCDYIGVFPLFRGFFYIHSCERFKLFGNFRI